MVSISIVCLIYKSVNYLKFVKEQIHKYTNLDNNEFYFVANDANEEVLNYLKDNNIHHYIFNNTPENVKNHGTLKPYINNVYRAWNFGGNMAKGKYIVFINSDMAFSPNWLENLMKHKKKNNIVSSRLIESGRFKTQSHGIIKNFGFGIEQYNEIKFNKYIKKIKIETTKTGGLYMPILISKKHFLLVKGFPEGNILKGSKIFSPIIAEKKQKNIPGDKVFIHKLSKYGINHITSFSSIVYHFQNGEKCEN